MKLRRLFKRLTIGIGFTILLLCLIVIGTFALILYYPQLGRLGGFQELRQSVNLEGTNYILELYGYQVLLKNTLTQSLYTTPLRSNTDYPMLYRVLHHQDNIYLIAGGEHRGGNIGGFWFEIYNITDEPYGLQGDNAQFSWLSCTYPRLNGNVLEFETAHQCDGFLLEAHKRFYSVRLR